MSSSPPEPDPCRCETEEQARACRRSGFPMLGHLWDRCRGVRCEYSLSVALRRLWDGLPRVERRTVLDCIFHGTDLRDEQGKAVTRECTAGCLGKTTRLKVFECKHPIRTGLVTVQDCAKCAFKPR